MPKTRSQKEEILKKIEDKIKRSKSIFFASYNKLTMSESETLRNELEKEQSEFMVAQKTITNFALKNTNLDVVDTRKFEGQMAVVFGYEDEVAPAKILDKFKKSSDKKVDFLGGVLEGKFLNANEVSQLAGLPSKLELYAKLVGSINSPISGFVNVMAGNIRSFVNVLKAIEEKKA